MSNGRIEEARDKAEENGERYLSLEGQFLRERMLGKGQASTDRDGYQMMLAAGREHTDRIWAVEGCNGIGRHVAQRLLADGETVLDVPAKLSARARVFSTGQARTRRPARARTLIEPAGGTVVAEYFDCGSSRSPPWKRRPEAARLLAAIRDPARGFDAVVIGEPQRAFYGNQFGLTFPLFVHYGVGLWVPEVGGAVDPGSDAHDLVMALYGGMSKGERNRIKIRVRSAMAAQAATEGRFLGGRPPYGYRLADAGPHPNPAKAADGRRLHRLEPDPGAALVVQRMQSSWNNDKPHYRCVYPTEYGLANTAAHPRSVYVREELIIPVLDRWLLRAFAPERLPAAVAAMADVQDEHRDAELAARAGEARRIIADCDQRLARYRAALAPARRWSPAGPARSTPPAPPRGSSFTRSPARRPRG